MAIRSFTKLKAERKSDLKEVETVVEEMGFRSIALPGKEKKTNKKQIKQKTRKMR